MLQIDKSSFYLTILLKKGYLPLLSSSSILPAGNLVKDPIKQN